MDSIIRRTVEGARQPIELVVASAPPSEPPDYPCLRKLEIVDSGPEPIASGTLEEAREKTVRAMREYLAIEAPQHVLLERAAPGTGKTTAGVHMAEELAAQGLRVLYAAPRHDFFADVLNIADHPDWWFEWQPRQAEDSEKHKPLTCGYVEPISDWMGKGYPGMAFCRGVCGWDYVNKGCPYHAQKKTHAPIIFGQHMHVALAHPLQFDVVIGDESPMSAFLHEWRIPARWIAPSGMDPTQTLTHMLHGLAAHAASDHARLEGPNLMARLGGAQDVLDACQSFAIDAGAVALAPSVHRSEDASNADYFHLPALVHMLSAEAEAAVDGKDYPYRVATQGGDLVLLMRRPVNDKLPRHIIWLDATGNKHIYESLFGRPVEVVDASPAMLGSVYQVYDRANNKSYVAPGGKAGRMADQLAKQITRIIEIKGYRNPAVITFEALAKAGDDDSAELKGMQALPMRHFYAARGTNAFEGCDALFVAGTPSPSREALTRIARMLFFERMSRFEDRWTTAIRPYAYQDPTDGKFRAYAVNGFWHDPDLEAVLWASREAEIIQSAHRARPAINSCDVWLLTNLPLPELPPTRLLSIQEALEAPQGVDVFLWDTVLWQAEGIVKEKGFVTVDDLTESLGVHRHTASKYIDILIDRFQWQKAAAPSAGGRPPKAATNEGTFVQRLNNLTIKSLYKSPPETR